jgi:hypothetical protein
MSHYQNMYEEEIYSDWEDQVENEVEDFEEEMFFSQVTDEEDYETETDRRLREEREEELKQERIQEELNRQPTEEEMQLEYEYFLRMEKEEREAREKKEAEEKARIEEEAAQLKARQEELAAWALSIGVTVDEIPGTFEQKLQEMDFNKECQRKAEHEAWMKLKAEREAKEAEERAKFEEQRLIETEKARKTAWKRKLQQKKSRGGRASSNKGIGPNAQKKQVGVVQAVDEKKEAVKRAARKERRRKKKEAESKRRVIVEEPVTKDYQPVIEEEEEEEEYVVPVVTKTQVGLFPVEAKKSHIRTITREEFDTIEQRPRTPVVKTKAKKKVVKKEEGWTTVKRTSKRSPKSPPKSTPKSTPKKKGGRGTPLQMEFGVGIIAAAKQERCKTDARFAARTKGFEMLGSPEEMKTKLKGTRMCRSVALKKRCPHGKTCRFAHSLDELVRKECAFGAGCRLVKSLGNGMYQDKPSKRTGKTCSCWHQDEKEESYCKRMKIPLGKSPKKVAPKVVRKVVRKPAPVAPWAKQTKVVEAKVEPKRKSRWGPPVQPKVEAKVEPTVEKSNAWVAKPKVGAMSPPPLKRQTCEPVKRKRKSRWDEKPKVAAPSTPTIIRVPKAMAAKALEMALNRGLTDFQIIEI